MSINKELAALLKLVEARNAEGIREEDLKSELERDAYKFWRFQVAQHDMGMDEENEEPMTYEESVAMAIRHSSSPELRAQIHFGMDPRPFRCPHDVDPYEYHLQREREKQPEHDEELAEYYLHHPEV